MVTTINNSSGTWVLINPASSVSNLKSLSLSDSDRRLRLWKLSDKLQWWSVLVTRCTPLLQFSSLFLLVAAASRALILWKCPILRLRYCMPCQHRLSLQMSNLVLPSVARDWWACWRDHQPRWWKLVIGSTCSHTNSACTEFSTWYKLHVGKLPEGKGMWYGLKKLEQQQVNLN